MSWPFWPGSKQTLLQGEPETVRALVKFVDDAEDLDNSNPESDAVTKRADLSHALLKEMGPRAVPTFLDMFSEKEYRSVVPFLFEMDPRGMAAVFEAALKKDEPSSYFALQFAMIAAQKAPDTAFTPAELRRTLDSLWRFAAEDEASAKIAGFCLGIWPFDDGEFIEKLMLSDNEFHRFAAAAAAVDGMANEGRPKPSKWYRSMHTTIEYLLDDRSPRVSAVAAYATRFMDFTVADKWAVKAKLKRLSVAGDQITIQRAKQSLARISVPAPPTQPRVLIADPPRRRR